MLPFWIDLGSLPVFELIPFVIAGMTLFFLPASGAGSRT